MLRRSVRVTACVMSAGLLFTGVNLNVHAAGVSSVLPNGGVNISLDHGTTLETIQTEVGNTNVHLEPVIALAEIEEMLTAAAAAPEGVEPSEEESYRNLVIAQVNKYVNVRSLPSEEGEIIGKLYNNSVGVFISEQDGWYEIQSGSVVGYVKGEYCVTGEDAVGLAREVGTRIAQVTCDGLFVRKEPTTEASILGMVAQGDELVVYEEIDGWVKVDIEEGMGWVSADYVSLHTEFVQAESREEEAARLAKEEEERRRAREAAAQRAAATTAAAAANSSASTVSAANVTITGDNAGAAVAEYAVQFVGNPYVYGGTSLTNGADCSGFVMSVYANFGVSLPHSSAADRNQGSAVDGIENALPGDLICYSGHVALYIGNGQIVHASNSRTGIIISNADYRKILAIRRIF